MDGTTTRFTRRAALGLLGAALVTPRSLRAEGLETLSGAAFGTTWSAVAPEGSGLAALGPAIAALFDGIDREMSPWRADSAVSRFNAAGAGRHALPAETLAVTNAALGLAEATDGVFDPTVGPLVARWGFGPIGGGRPDWRGLAVSAGAVAKTRGDLTLDLCGIAKGRALDLAVDMVREAGVPSLLFDLGGELRAVGRHPSGRPWRVAVEPPLPGAPAPAVLALEPGMAVATSGSLAQSYGLGERRYGHIIDPKAERPAGGALLSVTVAAPDAMTADGWATALFAAGEEAGPALARAAGISALFVAGEGPLPRQVRTGAMNDIAL